MGLVRYSQTRLVTLTRDSPAGVTEPSGPINTPAPAGRTVTEEPPEPPPEALASPAVDEPAVDVLEQPEEASQPPSTTTATVRNQEALFIPKRRSPPGTYMGHLFSK